MFWTDVSLRTIAIARLNGTQSRILVNSGINTPGIYSALLMLRTLVYVASILEIFFIKIMWMAGIPWYLSFDFCTSSQALL